MSGATAYPPCGVGWMMSPGQPTAASSTSWCMLLPWLGLGLGLGSLWKGWGGGWRGKLSEEERRLINRPQ